MPSHKITYKNFFCFLFCCVLFQTPVMGQRNQLPRLDKAKMGIVGILKNLDYNEVKINDGIIYFSDESNSFSLDCSEESDELFFGKLAMVYKYDDIVTFDRVTKFSLSHNFKATKIVQTDTGYSFRCEFYFTETDYIHETIGYFINAMRKAETMLIAKCKSYAEERTIVLDSLSTTLVKDSLSSSVIGSFHIISNKAVGDTVSVYVRVYGDNSLMTNDSSPEDFSFKENTLIENDKQKCSLSPWLLPENFNPTNRIRYEIWDDQGKYLLSCELNKEVLDDTP